jgi:hypothetical protein
LHKLRQAQVQHEETRGAHDRVFVHENSMAQLCQLGMDNEAISLEFRPKEAN